ncbi:MAG: DUF1566 domain-containing protein, partial [Bacteroidaceae bacterium]|nr:DUF1566 domain-containing protein [Bacteroidaceae bacterium]
TYNAGQPSYDGSDISAGQTWTQGDKVALFNVKSKKIIVPLTYNGSAFTGESSGVYTGARLAFFYPYEAIQFTHSDTVTYTINLAGQDGTQQTLKDYKSSLTGSISVSDQGTTVAATMQTLQAIAHFAFNHQGTPIANIVRVELMAKEGTLFSQRTYNVRNQSWTSKDNSDLVVENAHGLNGSMVVNLLPTESVCFGVSIETASGLHYRGQATESVSIESGCIYDFTIDCEVDNVKAHIGDYYYNDGSFSAELDYGKTPVGIVFALTDEYGSDINNNLNESLHGRAVSFSDLTSQTYRWAFSSLVLYDVPHLANYTGVSTDAAKDSLAYLPYLKEGKEDTYYTDSCHINLSIDRTTGHMATWPTTGALTSFKGYENTVVCDSSLAKYPAAYQVRTLVRAGINKKRWYMPSTGELALLYELWRQHIITAATKPGFINFEEFAYWSSDECDATNAWAINFFSGMVFRNNKLSYYRVRPCTWF